MGSAFHQMSFPVPLERRRKSVCRSCKVIFKFLSSELAVKSASECSCRSQALQDLLSGKASSDTFPWALLSVVFPLRTLRFLSFTCDYMKTSDVAITLILRDSLGCPSFDCLGNSTGCLCYIIGFLKWRFLISHSWSRGTHGSASWDVFLVLLYVLARLILEEIEKKKHWGFLFGKGL